MIEQKHDETGEQRRGQPADWRVEEQVVLTHTHTHIQTYAYTQQDVASQQIRNSSLDVAAIATVTQ